MWERHVRVDHENVNLASWPHLVHPQIWCFISSGVLHGLMFTAIRPHIQSSVFTVSDVAIAFSVKPGLVFHLVY